MLSRLATFLHANARRVLFAAVIVAAVAGVFGTGVAKHMSPYGANDPATQSVQATNKFEAASGRQIDPGIVALVSSGNVHSAAARQRVEHVASQLRAQPHVAGAVSYYDTHDPAMASTEVQRAIESAAGKLRLETRHLPSGAGHDAQAMASLMPMGMIFVPSIGGISHSPKELTSWQDCANGANVLLETVMELAR